MKIEIEIDEKFINALKEARPKIDIKTFLQITFDNLRNNFFNSFFYESEIRKQLEKTK